MSTFTQVGPTSLCTQTSRVSFVLTEEPLANLSFIPQDVVRVIFVRHGECMNNLHDIMGSICPDENNGLTPKGEDQARLGGETLRQKIQRADFMMTSPNTRAKQTAKIVAQSLGVPPEEIIVKERLREEFFGSMEGRPFLEFKASFGTKSRFIGGSPGGETGDQVKERIETFFLHLLRKPSFHGKTVVCCTHWFPIAQALRISGVFAERLGDRKVQNGECVAFRLT